VSKNKRKRPTPRNSTNKSPASIPATSIPPAPPPAPPAPIPPSPSTTAAPTPPPPFKWTLSGVGTIVAILISLFSLGVNYQQRNLNQSKEDRAAGRIKAKFEFTDTDMYDPKVIANFIKKKKVTDEPIFRLDSFEELVAWEPSVAVKNIGDEVIDGLRIEIHLVGGMAYGKDVEQKQPPPIIVPDMDSAEAVSFGKLMPQRTAHIMITQTLLQQMLHSRIPFYPDDDHESFFIVQVLCHIAGGAGYDRMEPPNIVRLHFHWRPTGFRDQKKCDDFIKMPLRVKLV
jgi:hypothetical protein